MGVGLFDGRTLLSLLLFSATALATPQLVRVDGALFNASGAPLNGVTVSVQVSAFAAATGGSALWTSNTYAVVPANGRFTVALDTSTGGGLVNQIGSLGSTTALWFELSYNGVVASPRFKARGTLFAVSAVQADTLRGVTTTTAEKNSLSGVTANVQTQINTLRSSFAASPAPFSFTNQTGIALNATITSNGVVLSGMNGAVPGACTRCTDIVRNGTSLASTWGVFLQGDTVAIKQLSSVTALTTTTASLTIGTTTSSTWSVTTASGSVNSFSFTNLNYVMQSSTIASNAVTLAGSFANATATCGAGCVGISRNGGSFSAGPVTGFGPGDTIAIQQITSGSTDTPTTASVTVGSTSTTWSVRTTDINYGNTGYMTLSVQDATCSSLCSNAGWSYTDNSGASEAATLLNVPVSTSQGGCYEAGGGWGGGTCSGGIYGYCVCKSP